MLRIYAVALIALLAVVATTSAQVVYDNPRAWFTGATCPANWAALTPTGGPAMTWSRAAVESAWTVNGTLDVAALDAALADGSVVSLRPGRAAQVRCAWRPLGGTP